MNALEFQKVLLRWVIPVIGFIGVGVVLIGLTKMAFFGATKYSFGDLLITATYSILLIFWSSFEEWKLSQRKND